MVACRHSKAGAKIQIICEPATYYTTFFHMGVHLVKATSSACADGSVAFWNEHLCQEFSLKRDI